MKQTSIEGTEPRTKRSAAELAQEAEDKARRYRRRAVMAEEPKLAKLNLAIHHGLERCAADVDLRAVRGHLLDALTDLERYLDSRSPSTLGNL